MIDKASIQDFPPMTASLLADNSGVFRVGTAEQYLTATDEGTARRQLVELMQAEARKSGRPIRVTVTDPTSVTVLLIGVDGELQEEPQSTAPARTAQRTTPPPAAAQRVPLIQAPPPTPAQPAPARPAPAQPPTPPRAAPVQPSTPAPVPVQPKPPVSANPQATTTPQPVPPQRPTVQQPAFGTPPFQPVSNQPNAQQPVPSQRAVPVQQSVQAPPAAPAQQQHPVPQQQQAPGQPAATARRDLRDAPSFLAPPTIGPAQQGLAGLLNKLGFSVPPSASERAERDDVHAVSRHFPRRRTISVANQKGGANKTPTVVNLSSVFARYGGGGVAAWDNNETMGTLGWRTEQGGHDSTVLDLLAAASDLLSPGAERADLSRFVHHQPGDKYEVLRSAADGEHVVTADEVDLVHRVLAKYYRLIVMDSGNSAGAPNWRRMVELTDQLVIPTTTVEDKKEGARLTLTAVSRVSERGAELARNAVVIVSEAEAKDTSIANAYAEDFRPYVRDVVVVPFDPALKNGVIRHDALRSSTQRAWLAAAAAVSRGL
ncbi:chromosome partitioning protein ParA [Plantibacter sp. CFBP 8798]|uniref:chromosome partitioning protein ParA n=1 Tax=Plantibacter sp. CFBP 8798 TaxID=2775268 RepID=UPI001780210E|nr:chromosome partitioning protein ParA [Plantibacter sp. CFBP 8798]MBD8464657.1 chromosome partitioning protein ParA [Plantibacter sp. CFBP 8798]